MATESKPMERTILFLVPRMHTNMLGWIDGLSQLGIKNKVFAMRSSRSENYQFGTPQFIENMAPKFSRLIGKLPLMKRIEIPSFKWLVKEINTLMPNYIVVRLEMNIASLIFLLAVKSTKIPFIIYTQWPLLGLDPIRRHIRSLIALLASTIVITPCLSRFDPWANYPVSQNFHKKVILLPFSVPMRVTKVKERKKTKEGSGLLFLTVGKFQFRKGHLESIKTLLNNEKFITSNSRVTIIGEVTTDEHKKVFRKISDFLSAEVHGERVKLRINLPHSDTLTELSNCDVFFLLSHSEPASIANIEAMSYGKPVIVRNGNGTANYIRSGLGGFVVSNSAEFDRSINEIIENPDFLFSCRQENLKRIRDISDPKTNAEFLIAILERNGQGRTSGDV